MWLLDDFGYVGAHALQGALAAQDVQVAVELGQEEGCVFSSVLPVLLGCWLFFKSLYDSY